MSHFFVTLDHFKAVKVWLQFSTFHHFTVSSHTIPLLQITMAYNFSGKVALVTGSSSGIGRDLVVNLAKLGAQVVVTGRNEDKIKTVVQECLDVSTAKVEVKVLPVVADLQKSSDILRLVEETISTFGKLDILVNNAGVMGFAPVTNDNFMEVFDRVFDTNVRGVLQLTKLAAPHLLKSKGSNIINISSCLSMRPLPGALSYCTSKAALDMVTKCLCAELSPLGIRINTVK